MCCNRQTEDCAGRERRPFFVTTAVKRDEAHLNGEKKKREEKSSNHHFDRLHSTPGGRRGGKKYVTLESITAAAATARCSKKENKLVHTVNIYHGLFNSEKNKKKNRTKKQ